MLFLHTITVVCCLKRITISYFQDLATLNCDLKSLEDNDKNSPLMKFRKIQNLLSHA